jgi:hypothetical protein
MIGVRDFAPLALLEKLKECIHLLGRRSIIDQDGFLPVICRFCRGLRKIEQDVM